MVFTVVGIELETELFTLIHQVNNCGIVAEVRALWRFTGTYGLQVPVDFTVSNIESSLSAGPTGELSTAALSLEFSLIVV